MDGSINLCHRVGGGEQAALEGIILLLSLIWGTECSTSKNNWAGWTLNRGRGPTEEIQ